MMAKTEKIIYIDYSKFTTILIFKTVFQIYLLDCYKKRYFATIQIYWRFDFREGCPIQPGSSLQKVVYLLPLLESNKSRRGIALDGQLKKQDTNLASTTL